MKTLVTLVTNKFGKIHISQYSHDNSAFCVLGVRPLRRPKSSQYGENISQAKVVMNLFRKLLFAKLIQSVEFSG